MNYSNNHINCSLFASRGSLHHPYELRNSFQSCHPRRTHLFFMLLRHNAPISKFHIDRQTRDKKKIRWDDIIHDEYDADIVDVIQRSSEMCSKLNDGRTQVFLNFKNFSHFIHFQACLKCSTTQRAEKKLKTWTWAFKNTKKCLKIADFLSCLTVYSSHHDKIPE